ncbi:unnamed protein product [Echinostoma caproni]|uniref:Endo/exonuclease/phosphatase domain-containing protein n=1 Tax=Echinostoma caproni TaxID=27848 RepID=A0A183B6X4_9TREM|nr:unnamed protein product [Echinostoma caproni]
MELFLFARSGLPVRVLETYARPVGVIYRTPAVYVPKLSASLQKYVCDGHCLVLGDFNAAHIDWETDILSHHADLFSGEFLFAVQALSPVQHVHVPMWIVGD